MTGERGTVDVAAERGRILRLMASDFEAAERAAEDLVQQAPGAAQPLMLLAYMRNFRKEHGAAVDLLRRAHAIAPRDREIAFNLAYCRLQSGDIAGAAGGFAGLDTPDAQLLHWCCNAWLGNAAPVPRLAPTTPAGLAALYFAGDRSALRAATAQPAAAAALVGWLNRYDCPGWGRLDDKATLAQLLAAQGFRHAPETHWRAETAATAGPDLWIAKHARLFGGQSVRIGRDPAELFRGDGWVVQRYIASPMLHEKRKFHLRLYLVVFDPAAGAALLFADGIARLAPFDYDAASLDDRRHITNTLRFKDDPEAAAATRVLRLSELGLAEAVRRSLSVLARDLARAAFAAGVHREHLAPGAVAIPPKLLGLDAVIDADGRPWLLEVERYPALHGGSGAADAVNERLFREVARVLCGEAPDAQAWTPLAPF